MRALLEQGFSVIAPESQLNGDTYWDTNLVHRNVPWEGSPDHALMVALFDAIARGSFGELNADRLFAMGVSSGGYMTSRMAVSYPGRFERLAIVSASYATCGGVYCPLPDMPEDHPPTLFLHGGRDLTAPVDAMWGYTNALEDQQTLVEVVVDDVEGHGWIPASPERVIGFFDP